MADFDLRSSFLKRQEMLALALTHGKHEQPTAVGDDTELQWIDMLRDFLPKRYCIDRAFAADSNDTRSDQQDVLIYDAQYSPILYRDKGALYVPAEAVYAAFEVKQEFEGYLGYAGEKIASVRVLERTSVPIQHAGGEHEPKKPAPIIGGILAATSGWKTGLGDPFRNALRALSSGHHLDVGCALRDGAFETSERGDGEWNMETSPPDVSLIAFALRLFSRLKSVATVPALDARRYGASLWP